LTSEQPPLGDFEQTDTGPDNEGWEEVVFSDVISINDYPSAEKGEEYRSVGMSDISRDQRKIEDWEYKEYSYSRPRFRNGQTLMARITPCLENGKTAFVDILGDDEVAVGSTEFIVLSDTDRTLPKFVYYTARRPEIRQFAIKRMTGTSGRQRVPLDIFDNKKIRLPHVNEQKKIVNVLDAIDSRIETNNRINQILEEMAQSLFSSWFVDLRNYDGETEYDEEFERDVPETWEKASLDSIAEFLNGKAWKDYSSENEELNNLPVVKIKELRNGVSDDSDEVMRSESPEKYILDDGDIVFSWSASLVLDLWSEGDAFLNQHLFKVTSQQYPRWFCYLWIDRHIRIFRHIAEAKKTTMGHIKRTDLEEAKVIVPPEEEIKIMSEKMKPIFEKRVESQVENRKLEELRDTLLPKLMSGEIRVNDIQLDELGVDSEV